MATAQALRRQLMPALERELYGRGALGPSKPRVEIGVEQAAANLAFLHRHLHGGLGSMVKVAVLKRPYLATIISLG